MFQGSRSTKNLMLDLALIQSHYVCQKATHRLYLHVFSGAYSRPVKEVPRINCHCQFPGTLLCGKPKFEERSDITRSITWCAKEPSLCSRNPPRVIMGTPSCLTNDYIQGVLRENCEDPGLTVESVSVNATTAKGDNYASTLRKVVVGYRDSKNNHETKLLVLKTLPSSDFVQSYLSEMLFFEREISAYSKLIPAMNNFTRTPVVSPKFYATDRPNTIILEDLSSRGFKMADRKKRLDLAHTSLALKALARFHALSYAVIQRDPTILDLFPDSAQSKKLEDMENDIDLKVFKDLASLIETWPGYERFSGKIFSARNTMETKEKEILAPREGGFNVLNHGDFWVNNMLFRYNEETECVEDVCCIDLQVIRYASPALDLQYFLSSSLADGIRDGHEDDLLELYHQSLAETLESAGLDSSIYSLDDLKKDYEEKALYGFTDGLYVLGAVAADPSEAFDYEGISEESLKNSSANPLEKTFRGRDYKPLLQQHLLYYEKHGVL